MTGADSGWFRREGLALLTDFYELTMCAGYLKRGRENQHVSFEYFFRSLPPDAGFAVAAGLDSLLNYLENLRFDEEDLAYLRGLGMFDEAFLDYLHGFRPACNVRAIPEGTLVFPHEPIVQVEGPIFEAQLIETALLNFMNFQTLIATKAARICLAAEGEPVLEFGLRRAHGPDGGVSGARAAYIGGCHSTSNVLAGKTYGIPVSGTHAHSWVMSFPSEIESFRAFARLYPKTCVLLVDTYDTVASGVPNAIQVFKELREEGIPVRPAIRLDSGDLAKLSKIAHRMMVDAGFDDPLIAASNDLDEGLIADLKRQGAKINAWGVGTNLITSHDSPSLSGVYKLVGIRENGTWLPRMKTTSNIEKSTTPGRKRVVRYYDADGAPIGDMLYGMDETIQQRGDIVGRRRSDPHLERRLSGAARTEELLKPVFEKGKRLLPPEPVREVRQRALDQIDALLEEFKRLRNPEIYRVILSPAVGKVKVEVMESINNG